MPFSLRCYIFGLVAAALSVVATLPLSSTDPRLLLALCVLVVATERLSRVKIGTSGWTMSVSLVVTLTTVVVLAPPAAAVVGLATSLTLPRLPGWNWTKQFINMAMMSLVPAIGSAVCYLAGGHAAGRFLNFPEFLVPVTAAVTTCLVANALIIAGYARFSSNTRFVDGLRGDIRRATMPYYSSGVLALIFLSLWHDIGWYTAPLVVVPMYIAHWSLSQYAKENAAHEGTIAALVQAVEIKDSYTRGHSERVARGSEMLAEQLKMPQDRRAMLRFAGLLHDIGKLGVPTRLLTSTGGLTEEEFKLLCMHPNHGVAVLRDIRFLTEVYEGVLYHHERLDGRGYPTGKSGEQIPEFARIIGVADAFDAMTSTRSYRAARSVEEAVAELRRGAGTQFDPALVTAFEAALEAAARSGTPWAPTELPPVEPQSEDGTTAAAAGPWPLPKRVPGFSFADHDDPFVPAEWFSDWYPSWLAHGGEPEADPDRPVGEVLGGIPGQRVAEPQDVAADAGFDDAAFDDGWSERMHSAVVREPGPEPDEGAEPEPAAESARWPQDPGLYGGVGLGSMRMRAATPDAQADPRGPAAGKDAAGGAAEEEADSVQVDAAASTADSPDSVHLADIGADADPISQADTPAPAADFDLRKPVSACQETDSGPRADGVDHDETTPGTKLGDPEAWAPFPGVRSASESAETPKPTDPTDPAAPDPHSAPSVGPSWFSRGSSAPSSALRLFGPADAGSWPPRDPDAKDSEESPA